MSEKNIPKDVVRAPDGSFVSTVSGRKPKSKYANTVRRLTIDEVSQMAELIITRDREALQAVIKDMKAPVLKVWFAAVAVKAITKGDYQALGAVLDRVIGKVKERVEWSTDPMNPLVFRIEAMSHAERLAEIEKYDKLCANTDVPLDEEIKKAESVDDNLI